MKLSLSQINSKLSRDNLEKHLYYIKTAKNNGSNLIIFPELSLNGYSMMDLVYEDAYEVSELNTLKNESKDIDILVGVALRVGYKIFNSAIYFSNGEVINIYHKNTLPNYGMFQEARFFFAGDMVDSFETKFGSVISVICEDLWNVKIIEKIVSIKPDFIYILSASPARGFDTNGLEIERKWNNILSTTAGLSGTYTIFVNRVGFEDGLGFWGGSRVVNPKGLIEKKASLFEEELLEIELFNNLSKTEKYLLRINN
jgi:predicted amidohydrolase